VIACLIGALFTIGAIWEGPTLYRAMGEAGHTLEAALTYSNLVFVGALNCWLLNTLACIERGTGTMLLPASVIIGGVIVTLSLSPALIFGWAPVPHLGIAGAALGFITYYIVSGVWSCSSISALAEVSCSSRCLDVVSDAPCSERFCLAGYGMGVRLEYLQTPLVFGFGAALISMVGTNNCRRKSSAPCSFLANSDSSFHTGIFVVQWHFSPCMLSLFVARRAFRPFAKMLFLCGRRGYGGRRFTFPDGGRP
jgi:hypothetical protein